MGYKQVCALRNKETEPVRHRRRDFVASGLAGALGVALSSCGVPEQLVQNPEIKADKKLLLKLIEGLPETFIKSLLEERVAPYFYNPTQATVERAGVIFRVYGSRLRLRKSSEPNAISGFNSIRGDFLPREKGLVYPLEKSTRKFPLPAIATEEEKLRAGLKKDDTPLNILEFDPQDPFVPGLAPEIIIETPGVREGKPALTGNVFENYVVLKELCGILLADLYLEELVKKHKELGLAASIRARNLKGEIGEAEIISQGFDTISSNDGRLKAARDIAENLIAYQAIKDTPSAKLFTEKGVFVPSMLSTRLDDNPASILYGSLEWAIKNEDAHKIYHHGDINKWP